MEIEKIPIADVDLFYLSLLKKGAGYRYFN